jgi:energy-converting hydrogenase B subunit D
MESGVALWSAILLVALMLIAALSALLVRSHLAAVVATSVLSLALTLLFVWLKAPDVAMTEGVVGAGLGSLILALALSRLRLLRSDRRAGDE